MSHRISQVNEVIKQHLNSFILTEIEFPKNCLATIVRVETSKDLRHAKVWISVIPTVYTKKILDKFNHRVGHFQYLLNQKLSTKPLPQLRFLVDETEKKASEIEALLDRIKESS